MKTAAQLAESIARFQTRFWERTGRGRPPVGVVNQDIYLPIKYLRKPFAGEAIEPGDVGPELAMSDYEFAFADRPVTSDDWMPFAAPWRAIPWLEACCGCPVRYASGSLAPTPTGEPLLRLLESPLPRRQDWFACLGRETLALAAAAPEDCWISPTVLRGASDILAAWRGMNDFYCDLYDDLAAVDCAADQVNRLLIAALDLHFSIVGPKHGGYGHTFGYWAPGRTIAIQEDALGMCRPEVFREIFLRHSAEVVRHLGAHVLFHLHSTGFQHYRDVLRIQGLAGLQMTIEANGPALPDLLPTLREILEQTRLVLFLDHGFERLPEILHRLPTDGLYLVVPEKCMPSEPAFREFTAKHWGRD